MHNRVFIVGVAVFLAAFMLMVSFSGARWYETSREAPLVYTQEPYVTDAQSLSRLSYEPGKAIILQVWGRRTRPDCWGQFTTTLAGPVNLVFPSVPAQIINTEPTDFNLRLWFQIPAELPDGVYKWRRVYSPTCDGVDLRPYDLEMFDARIKIERKKSSD